MIKSSYFNYFQNELLQSLIKYLMSWGQPGNQGPYGQQGQGQQGQGWGQGQQGQQGPYGQQGQGQQGQGWGQGQQGQYGQQGQGWGQGQQGNQAQQGWGPQGQNGIQGQGGWGQQGQQGFNSPSFIPEPYKQYKIVLSAYPNKALDSSADNYNKNKLILWSYHGGANQKWKFNLDNAGGYSIVNVQNGGTLQIPDHTKGQKCTQLHVSQPNNTINEKWKIVHGKNGYAIKSAFNDLGINVLGAQCDNGDHVGLWPYQGARNQTWLILPA